MSSRRVSIRDHSLRSKSLLDQRGVSGGRGLTLLGERSAYELGARTTIGTPGKYAAISERALRNDAVP